MSEKLTPLRARREMLSVLVALGRLNARVTRLFPAAEGLPGEGCILRETLVGIGQAQAYCEGFAGVSDEHLRDLIDAYGPATRLAFQGAEHV